MEEKKFDVIIIGGGPAGLSAGINCNSRNKKAAIFENGQLCEKIRKAPHVNNLIGFPMVTGKELSDRLINHAREANLTFVSQTINKIHPGGDTFYIQAGQEFYETKAVIITSGVAVKTDLKGELDFIGKGVSYCATCDGSFYKGKKVAVVSDYEKGEEEAKFLSEIASEVCYIPLYSNVGDLPDRIKVIKDKPQEIIGTGKVEKLILKENDIEVDGIFLERRSIPLVQLIEGLENDGRHIKIDCDMATNIPGVFAAGDCTGEPYQLPKAIGQGATAALSAAQWMDNQNKN